MLRRLIEKATKIGPYSVLILLVSITFFRTLTLKSYTSWDTFDLHTINFLYLSDAFRSGALALWNPFVLSGIPVLPNLYTSYFYGPIDLFLLGLSYYIDPIWLVEFSIVLLSILFGVGMFRLLKHFKVDEPWAVVFALISFFILIPPIVGQIAFLTSFAMFPWMVLFSINAGKESFFMLFIKTIFVASLFVKGYFYFNGIIFIVSFFFCIRNIPRESVLRFFTQKLILFIIPLLFFFILNFEAVLDWQELYKGFKGDFISEEPRLRSLVTLHPFFISDWMSTTKALFSFSFPAWSKGFYYFSPFVILGLGLFVYSKAISLSEKVIVCFLFILGIFLSTHSTFLVWLWPRLPFFNTFRWCMNHIYFSLFVGIYATARAFSASEKINNKFKSILYKLIWLTVGLSVVLSLFNQYSFRSKSWKRTLDSLDQYKSRVELKELSQNYRKLNFKKEFEYSDFSWLTTKIPISHGYNNAVSEMYWRMKDYPFNSSLLLFPTQQLAYKAFNRDHYDSDKKYVDAMMMDISLSGESVLFAEVNQSYSPQQSFVESIKLTPNQLQARVWTSSSRLLFITQHFHQGWKATVNGKSVNLAPVNYVLSGLVVPAGRSEIVLTYWPLTATLLLSFYLIVLLLLISLYAWQRFFRIAK